ncbi:MAG TPA: hypothetical protein VNB64_05185 [Solirubrobacteraceae bacterium]|nr:hypothetical protein [Solirubrobacteraceae bacterium]
MLRCALVTTVLLAAGATSSASAAGPPLTEPADRLAGALGCTSELRGAQRTPVLLVHGTGTTVEESWRSGYLHALPQEGIVACAVQLPARSMDDIQIASEYVVSAVRRMAAASGRKIAILGHSQGGLEPLWALRWWPDLPGLVEDAIGLAVPYNGTEQANDRCQQPCQPAVWQMRRGSRFMTALRAAPVPRGPAYTSIATVFDQLATPAPAASRLEGARNLVLQDLCNGRPVDHVGLVYDNLTYQLVLDAIGHPGPADPARLPAGICQTTTLAVDVRTFAQDSGAGAANLVAAFTFSPTVPAEPALFCYADPASPRGAGTICPAGAAGGAPRSPPRTAPRLRLQVSPRTVRAGRWVRLRFRVTSTGASPAGRARHVAAPGATVRIAGRAVRTGRTGRASLLVRFARPGAHRARASRRGARAATATVFALRSPRRPRFTG